MVAQSQQPHTSNYPPGYKMEKKESIPLVTEEARMILEEFLRRNTSSTQRQRSATTGTPLEVIYEGLVPPPLVGRSSSYRAASQESILSDYDGPPQNGSTSLTKSLTISASDYNYNKRVIKRESRESGDGTIRKSGRVSSEEALDDSPDMDLGGSESEEDETKPRHKKSFFKRATERLRQSFRKMNKDDEITKIKGSTSKLSDDGNNHKKPNKAKKMKKSRSKELEKELQDIKEKEKHKEKEHRESKKERSGSKLFRRNSKSTMKSPVSSDKALTPNIEVDSASPIRTPTSRSSSMRSVRSASIKVHYEESSDDKKRKSPQRKMSWRDGEAGGVFDNIIHNIRKGLRRRKSKDGSSGSDGSFRRRAKSNIAFEDRIDIERSPVPRRHTASNRNDVTTTTTYRRIVSQEERQEIDIVPSVPTSSSDFAVGQRSRAPSGSAQNGRNSMTLPGLIASRPRSPSHQRRPTVSMVTEEPDEVDSLPFHEKTEKEREEILERVAKRLAAIADNYVLNAQVSPADPSPNMAAAAADERTTMRLNSLERNIVDVLRDRGDEMTESMTLPTGAMSNLASGMVDNLSYGTFDHAMSQVVGQEPGWQQIGVLFQ
ncbi:unnamed protein product, partial [Owenia fusiformis]